MKEIERLIEKGVITNDYLKEEVICDFLVDIKRKKMWAIMLDMLSEFISICKKRSFSTAMRAMYLIAGFCGAVLQFE